MWPLARMVDTILRSFMQHRIQSFSVNRNPEFHNGYFVEKHDVNAPQTRAQNKCIVFKDEFAYRLNFLNLQIILKN